MAVLFMAGMVPSMGVYGWQYSLWPVWFPVLVFSPFIIDATVTLLKRLGRGEQVWKAHRSHYYQGLIQSGWSDKKMAFAEYFLMPAVGITALLLLDSEFKTILIGLVLWIGLYILLMRFIDKHSMETI